MKILISGSSGLVGTELKEYLKDLSYDVITLDRTHRNASGSSVYWNPQKGEIDLEKLKNLSPFDAIYCLGGVNIAEKRWSEARKKEIAESRIHTTKFLINTLGQNALMPKVFISASAVGYYGNTLENLKNERDEAGIGFLAETCRDWEFQSLQASNFGARVCLARFGIVLSGKGGALKKMLPFFKLGLGGVLGNGHQFVSWISLEDAVSALILMLTNSKVKGPVNVVTPEAITNKEFTITLARALNRPAIFPVPGFILRGLYGEMADEMLLTSSRIEPKVLIEQGFGYKNLSLYEFFSKL